MQIREIEIRYRVRGEVEDQLRNSAQVAAAVRRIVGHDPREHLCVLYIDARHRILDVEIVSIGTLTQSLVHPREVFRTAIHRSARGIIIAHQHPSGDPTPSDEDYEVTQRLIDAGSILGIEVLDHVVVTTRDFTSLREQHPDWF